ncbi:MAG: hypothetical protein KAX20_04795 [Candidatus Omnitrophica bacterium]|nr:hypothetical protein [Candidatus Omnitrophota bacterium]
MKKNFLAKVLFVFLLINQLTIAWAELEKDKFSPEEWERMKKLGIVSEEKTLENKQEGKGILGVAAGGRLVMRANNHTILVILIPLKKLDEWGRYWGLDRSRPAYLAMIDEKFSNVTVEGITPGIYELYANIKFSHYDYDAVVFRYKVEMEAGMKANIALSPIHGDVHQNNTAVGKHAHFTDCHDPPPRSRPRISIAVKRIENLCHYSSIFALKEMEERWAGEKSNIYKESYGIELIVKDPYGR